MDFTEFPAQWEWVALILGGVALLMAVQPFTQFIWGRPKIEIEFSLKDTEQYRYLVVYLFNRPVSNGLLKWLKVRREAAEDVFAEIRVENVQTQRVVVDQMIPEIVSVSKSAPAVSLPASSTPASILLVGAFNDGKSKVRDEKGDISLTPGIYRVSVKVHCAETLIEKRATFTIGVKPYELTLEPVKTS